MEKKTIERLTGFFKTTALITSAAAAAALVLTLLQYVDKRNADGMKRTESASISAGSGSKESILAAGIGNILKKQDGCPSAGAGRLSFTAEITGDKESNATLQRSIAGNASRGGVTSPLQAGSPLASRVGDKKSNAIPQRGTAILTARNDIPKAASTILEEEGFGGVDCSEVSSDKESPLLSAKEGSPLTTKNEDELWDFFKSMGCTDAGAAGAMGNLYAESRFISSAKSKNFSRTRKTGGGGLAGWMCRGRFQDLHKLAEKRGKSWEDMSLQKEFLKQELEGTYQHVKDVITSADDPEYAADYFCVYYEGCIICNASEGSIALGTGTKDGISIITGKKYQGLSFRKEMARVFYERHAER